MTRMHQPASSALAVMPNRKKVWIKVNEKERRRAPVLHVLALELEGGPLVGRRLLRRPRPRVRQRLQPRAALVSQAAATYCVKELDYLIMCARAPASSKHDGRHMCNSHPPRALQCR